jgi:signal transduction histidine kinase
MNPAPSLSRRLERPALDGARNHAVREARRSANRLIGWFGHLIVYALACLLLWYVAGFVPAVVVALAWGIALASHGFFAVIAPVLRDRWVAQAAHVTATFAPPEQRLVEQRGARSLEELSAAIAHEIRNPITAAKSLVQQIAEELTVPETVEQAKIAIEELDRVERSISHLLRYAREEPYEPAEVSLDKVIDSAVEMMVERAVAARVRILRELDSVPPLFGDAEQLRKVVANLIGNGIDALAEHGTENATVTVSAGQNLAGTEVWIRVADNGPGVAKEARDKVFKPFYTSKPKGTGLGLALVQKMLARHGGTIELESAQGPGAAFLVTLPLAPRAHEVTP